MAGSSRGATKRLMTELQSYQKDPNAELLDLGPADEDVMHWRAVMKGVEGTAYEGTSIESLLPSQAPAHPKVPSEHHINLTQAAHGSSTSTSLPPTPTRRLPSASSRPSATPTSTSRRARSASTCSRQAGRPHTPSLRL
jgi:hypothetical protein